MFAIFARRRAEPGCPVDDLGFYGLHGAYLTAELAEAAAKRLRDAKSDGRYGYADVRVCELKEVGA